MFNLGMGEIMVILMLALIFLGPKKFPELASGLGKLIREIRKTTSDVKNEIQLDEAIRKPFEELREAVTLHPEELKRRDKLRQELAEIQKQAEAAVAEAEANASHAPVEAPPLDALAGPGADPAGVTRSSETSADGNAVPEASEDEAHAAAAEKTPPPVLLAPAIPGAAPVGTVARASSGPVTGAHAPPAPPLAAVLAKGSGPVTIGDKPAAHPPGGSDFLRSLRAVPEGGISGKPEAGRPDPARLDSRRPRPGRPSKSAADVPGAADRGNTTQALTEADLAAITVPASSPPPPPPGQTGRRVAPTPTSPPPPRLPGSTPPKDPNR